MKKNQVVILSLLAFSIFTGFESYNIYTKAHDNKANKDIIDDVNSNFKKSPFTIEKMYDYILTSTYPEDYETFEDIIANWYDYFDRDTFFINKYGEKYSYDEYIEASKKWPEQVLKVWLLSEQKQYALNDYKE